MFSNNYWNFSDNAVGIGQQGLSENERKQYEARISDLKQENDRLHELLKQSLSK